MKKRQFFVGLILLLALVLFSTSVLGQNFLNDIFAPFQGLDIGEVYRNNWYFIDAVMYFIILIGASMYALGDRFQGRGGKAVVIGVGISLSIAAAYFEKTANFRLIEKLGPISIIIVLIIFAFAIYKMFTGVGGSAPAYSMLGFAIMFFYIQAQFPQLGQWINSLGGTAGGLLKGAWGLLNLAAVFFLGYGIWALIKQLGGFGGGAAAAPAAPAPVVPAAPRPPGTPTPPPPPVPSVPQPRIRGANVADRAVILMWEAPASGTTDSYVIRRYKKGRAWGYNLDKSFNGVGYYTTAAPTERVYVDGTTAAGRYRYSVAAVQGGASSPEAFFADMTTANQKCNYNFAVIGVMPTGGIGIEVRLISTRGATANLGGNLIIYGTTPTFNDLITHNIPIRAPEWQLFPPAGATTIIGLIQIPPADWAAMGGVSGGSMITLFVDTQHVNI